MARARYTRAMIQAEELLAGPRGRRLLLELAEHLDEDVRLLAFGLSYELDPGKGQSRVLMRFDDGDGEPEADPPAPTVDAFVHALADIDLARVTPARLDAALGASVGGAMYWQPPSGEDVLAALPEVVDALRPLASAAAQHPPDWWSADRRVEQWAIEWRDPDDPVPLGRDAAAALLAWKREAAAQEEWSRREAAEHPDVAWSGTWWSIPTGMVTTAGLADAATPAGLRYVEDSFGWEVATAIAVRGAGSTYEIHNAQDWAELCRRFPLEVTASRRRDWYETTGRDGRWVIPDWPRVAGEWDAVHLSARGYLGAATLAIGVDDERASVIAGWSPDLTVWLTDSAREWDGERVEWRRDDDRWVRADAR